MGQPSEPVLALPVRTISRRTRRYRFCQGYLLVILLEIVFAQRVYAQVSTYKVQAVFLYNFTKYINWPQSGTTMVIGVMGNSGVVTELNTTLKDKKTGDKAFEIKQLLTTTEAAKCNIVYLPSGRSKELKDLISAVKGKGVLIVSEEDLAGQGAGISFLQVEEKLRFKINAKVLKEAGFQVSSALLGLAIVI